MRQVDPLVPFRAVRASRGKVARAEPAAALYEQGRGHPCAGARDARGGDGTDDGAGLPGPGQSRPGSMRLSGRFTT